MKKIKRINLIKFGILILILGIAFTILIKNRHFIMNLKVSTIINFAESANTKFYAIIITLVIFLIKPIFVIIPSSIIAIANGLIFGPIEGFCVTMVGNFLSCTVGFYMARLLGQDFIEGILGKKMSKFQENFKNKEFIILFSLRMIPIIPLDPVSYACGLSSVSFKKFISASLLGVAPETLCYSFLGDNFDKPFSPAFIIPIVLLIVALISSRFILKKINVKENKENS
ncbi:MAG: TVP38/TMEM64 family protein [Clostridium sp.]